MISTKWLATSAVVGLLSCDSPREAYLRKTADFGLPMWTFVAPASEILLLRAELSVDDASKRVDCREVDVSLDLQLVALADGRPDGLVLRAKRVAEDEEGLSIIGGAGEDQVPRGETSPNYPYGMRHYMAHGVVGCPGTVTRYLGAFELDGLLASGEFRIDATLFFDVRFNKRPDTSVEVRLQDRWSAEDRAILDAHRIRLQWLDREGAWQDLPPPRSAVRGVMAIGQPDTGL